MNADPTGSTFIYGTGNSPRPSLSVRGSTITLNDNVNKIAISNDFKYALISYKLSLVHSVSILDLTSSLILPVASAYNIFSISISVNTSGLLSILETCLNFSGEM